MRHLPRPLAALALLCAFASGCLRAISQQAVKNPSPTPASTLAPIIPPASPLSPSASPSPGLILPTSPAGTPATTPEPSGLIAFTLAGGTSGIYAIEASGDGFRPLVEEPAFYRDRLFWSPDGAWLYYASDEQNPQGEFDLWRVSSSGGERQRLTTGETIDAAFALSPQGDRLAYAPGSPEGNPVVLLTSEGATRTPLTLDLPGRVVSLSWSLSGDRLALFIERADESRYADLYLLAADGSDLAPLLEGDLLPAPPAWSPDGRWVAIARQEESGAAIVLVAVESGEAQSIASPGGVAHEPLWSPDGQRIVFTAYDQTGTVNLFLVPPHGGQPQQLTDEPQAGEVYGRAYAWSPDGAYLAFSSQLPGEAALNLFLTPGDAAWRRQLTTGLGGFYIGGVDWFQP